MNSLEYDDYRSWFLEVKSKIKSSQLKSAQVINASLIEFYWEFGKIITLKQTQTKWGDKLIHNLAIDLKIEFPDMAGFSVRNLKYFRQFYQFYTNSFGQQLVAQNSQTTFHQIMPLKNSFTQIPWGHNIIIFSKSLDVIEATFYIEQTIQNNWSRDVLNNQIKTNLYNRKGKAITNFKTTLPDGLSDLAQQTLKDPYVFDFISLSEPYKEKDIEKQLIKHITQFLLELGKGFAFVGKQYKLEIAENDYFIALLFYHIHLKCYVVIELKNTKFIPEFAGKLNFYLSAIDTLIKRDDDKPTIGIILCRDKNSIEAEFSLRDVNKPMGISEFELTEMLPDELKSSFPTIEEIENELKKIEK